MGVFLLSLTRTLPWLTDQKHHNKNKNSLVYFIPREFGLVWNRLHYVNELLCKQWCLIKFITIKYNYLNKYIYLLLNVDYKITSIKFTSKNLDISSLTHCIIFLF